ncbi:hypothetical protein C8R45DRAFT_926918 [Mycena sanguinolenta]|nr:hypothetical protein C8R45DRAFT_926918 [Mycena sanguinolenta]
MDDKLCCGVKLEYVNFSTSVMDAVALRVGHVYIAQGMLPPIEKGGPEKTGASGGSDGGTDGLKMPKTPLQEHAEAAPSHRPRRPHIALAPFEPMRLAPLVNGNGKLLQTRCGLQIAGHRPRDKLRDHGHVGVDPEFKVPQSREQREVKGVAELDLENLDRGEEHISQWLGATVLEGKTKLGVYNGTSGAANGAFDHKALHLSCRRENEVDPVGIFFILRAKRLTY